MIRRFDRYRLSLVSVVVFACAFARPLVAAAESPNDLIVIANKGVPMETVELGELRAIFLKKMQYWAGGLDIVPINAPAGSPLRARFVRDVLGMSPEDELRYWQDLSVKKGLRPPGEIPTEKRARIKAVFYQKGAISYVLRRDLVKGVTKSLLIIPAPK